MLRFIFLLLFFLIVGPIVLLFAAMDASPVVKARAPNNATDAARAREIFRKFRKLTEADSEGRRIRISQSDINSMLASALHAVPFVRGRAVVASDAVWTTLSVDASGIPGGGWLNLRAAIKPSDSGLNLTLIQLGAFHLPSDFVLQAVVSLIDAVLGDDLGQVAIKSIDGVSINGKEIDLGVAITRAERKALARRAKQLIRVAAGISDPDSVRNYYLAFHAAVRDGHLQPGGSVVPFLRFAMDRAIRRTNQGLQSDEFRSALHAVAIYCGHHKYQNVVGEVVPEHMKGRPTACSGATLGGRRDLRQHFVISAGLKAASYARAAFAIGEFKELLDSNRGGSGFSFDDLAADRAGIRFATTILETKPEQCRSLLDVLVTERAIFPDISGLPVGLSDVEFEHRFGDVETPAYRKVLAKIERRIDGLDFFSPLVHDRSQ